MGSTSTFSATALIRCAPADHSHLGLGNGSSYNHPKFPLGILLTVSACMQVVAFQATMELMAQQFPGAFTGYNMQVVESHQRSKVDTSGTAKAIVQSFQDLGIDFNEVRMLTLAPHA